MSLSERDTGSSESISGQVSSSGEDTRHRYRRRRHGQRFVFFACALLLGFVAPSILLGSQSAGAKEAPHLTPSSGTPHVTTGNAVVPVGSAPGQINGYTNVPILANDDGTWPCGGSGNAPASCPVPGYPSLSSPTPTPLGFTIDFYGQSFNQAYVNNNGNITFAGPLSDFTPSNLTTFGSPIIAPFFADVDTRAGNIANFGTGTLNGHKVFVVNWPGVGCYPSTDTVTDNFQMILIDRPDAGTNTSLGDDFEMEFNFNSIQWDTGQASGGDVNCQNGTPGNSAYMGFSNGTSNPGGSFNYPGSGVPNAFLDSSTTTGLVHNDFNSTVLGRYIFPVFGGNPSVGGYDLVGRDGGVFVFGTPGRGYYGSLPGLGISVNNIVGIVPTYNYQGYFLVGSDGGVFAFGNAPFEDSLPGIGVHVNDIVGIVPTSDDAGYFLVGRDGGVFSFGDAPFENSLPGLGISVNDIVGIVPTGDNQGYFLVGADGAVYAFGDATYSGGANTSPITTTIVGIAAFHGGQGYWLVGADGQVFAFGLAQTFGDLPSSGVTVGNIVGIIPTSDDAGYFLVGSDGGVFAFGDANDQGSLPGLGVVVNDIVGGTPTL